MSGMENVTVGFLGAGNMAEAIVRGLVAGNVIPSEQITVSDPSAARRELLATSFGVSATEDNREVLARSRVVVLAVKPQVMAEALAALAAHITEKHLVVSIAAGIRTERLDALCGGKAAIIRVMPNTPALVGQGVSALCAGPRAGEAELDLVETLFRSVGVTLRVTEDQMDGVTALSGSGPAYVFYWMEALLAAAARLGFGPEQARTLVYGTLSGSASLALASPDSPDQLRARVTSKGGTTEAAIRSLDEHWVREHLEAAVLAAARRSAELSKLA